MNAGTQPGKPGDDYPISFLWCCAPLLAGWLVFCGPKISSEMGVMPTPAPPEGTAYAWQLPAGFPATVA